MKNSCFKKSSLIGASCFLFLFQSCTKSDTTSLTNSFTWTYNGKNFTAFADSAFRSNFSGYPFVTARKNADPASINETFVIELPSLAVSTYDLSAGTPPVFSYTDGSGNTFFGNSGLFNITSNKNNLISGNFSATLNNTKVIAGQFTAMPIKP